jgi:putative toxin-antitoxin system antitoxin component (TIGR02293 family)
MTKTAVRPRARHGGSPARASASAGSGERRGGELRDRLGHDAILQGIEARLVKQAVEGGLLRLDEVHRLIPPSTLARKVREGRRLTREEGDRLARLVRIKSYAQDVFEDAGLAATWMSEPNPALGGRSPDDLVVTDEGTRAVETVLRRIDHGDYS